MSIAIIGGADGPTAIFLAASSFDPVAVCLAGIVFLLSAAWIRRPKRH